MNVLYQMTCQRLLAPALVLRAMMPDACRAPETTALAPTSTPLPATFPALTTAFPVALAALPKAPGAAFATLVALSAAASPPEAVAAAAAFVPCMIILPAYRMAPACATGADQTKAASASAAIENFGNKL